MSPLLELIRIRCARTSHPAAVFGNDLAILYRAEELGLDPGGRKAFYRPCAEPVLLSFWERFEQLTLTDECALNLVGLLCGSRQEPRSARVVGVAPDGGRFAFKERPDSNWLHQVLTISRDGTFEAAAEVARLVLWNHPFTDGNGRLARALFYLPLIQGGAINKPCLGLNGAFDVSRDALALAFRRSIASGNRDVWCDAVADAVRLGLELMDGCR